MFCLVYVGDKLIIAEQSLDQKDFIVVNTRTQSQGKVPTNFVKIGEWNCDHSGHSHLGVHSL